MSARAQTATMRRGRWALSFADLCLLLLGFFVLLHANASQQREMMHEIARSFGAPATMSERVLARDLFAPGEAMLSARGAARLAAMARAHGQGGGRIEIHSVGQDRTGTRYDGWDLSAARLGAVARALDAAGVDRARLMIRGLDQGQKGSGEQAFTFVHLPPMP